MKVEVAVLGSPSLTVLMLSVHVNNIELEHTDGTHETLWSLHDLHESFLERIDSLFCIKVLRVRQ